MGLEAKSDTRTTPTSAGAGSVGALLITPTPVEVGGEYYYDSICMFVCMCPSVCLRTYHRNSMSMQSSPNFSRVIPMAVTRFSSDGVAICDMLCTSGFMDRPNVRT